MINFRFYENMNNRSKLVIIVPCFNEEAVLSDTAVALLKVLQQLVTQGKISEQSQICFINDGSCDKTWSIIEKLSTESCHFKGINLSRNFGHQCALLAGLFTLSADAFITIDADLQDDEKVIIQMVDNFNKGYDIVYGVRDGRKSDHLLKRMTAVGFYKLLRILGAKIIYNHADFRLMSSRAVEALKLFPERNLFLRALVPLLGLPSTRVLYDRKPREKGESKYPFRKMLSFAWDGITSFSIVPLRFVTMLGICTFFLSIPLIVYSTYRWFFGETVIGWTSLITVVCLFSGVQLISVGIIGEYIGKIYKETKMRPNFIIQEKI